MAAGTVLRQPLQLLLLTALFIIPAPVHGERLGYNLLRRCGNSPFNYGWRKLGSLHCFSCPNMALARQFAFPKPGGFDGNMDYESICYDRFEVTASLICPDASSNIFECSAGTDTISMDTAMDGWRQEAAGNNSSPLLPSPAKLAFVFASGDQPQSAERFVIWKKAGCGGQQMAARYATLAGRDQEDTGCWKRDEGDDFVMVTCYKMVTWALLVYTGSPVSDCDIPAEVEVYGTRSQARG